MRRPLLTYYQVNPERYGSSKLVKWNTLLNGQKGLGSLVNPYVSVNLQTIAATTYYDVSKILLSASGLDDQYPRSQAWEDVSNGLGGSTRKAPAGHCVYRHSVLSEADRMSKS